MKNEIAKLTRAVRLLEIQSSAAPYGNLRKP